MKSKDDVIFWGIFTLLLIAFFVLLIYSGAAEAQPSTGLNEAVVEEDWDALMKEWLEWFRRWQEISGVPSPVPTATITPTPGPTSTPEPLPGPATPTGTPAQPSPTPAPGQPTNTPEPFPA